MPFTVPHFAADTTPLRPEPVAAAAAVRRVLPDDAILSQDFGVRDNWFMPFWEARMPGVHVDADIRPPATGTWALPPISHKEPAFGAPVRRATPA